MSRQRLTALALAAGLLVGGCGYSLSPSPYGLAEPLTVSVPVAGNQSRYADLGPQLTAEVIGRLNSSPTISVRENSASTLRLTIQQVVVSGGAWETRRTNNMPTHSASRVAVLVVEAVLERPNPAGGPPLARRQVFASQRNFMVTNIAAHSELQENEAFQWVITDLGQKIAQAMFSEF
ncbi:MAG: hypothetical protein LBV79_05425 [Candidatus Adiutrix sp.]|jgi:hypothetical protein|nr:hypothetical protein [Candidatus Adiutrix sp.]